MPFERNVFINCPFDKAFIKFLEPLLFTVLYCDFTPLISQTTDSGSTRLENILKLIKNSRYSIHDLSRMVSLAPGEYARFNMPFELGIDMGIRNSGDPVLSGKKSLVLDTHAYRYHIAISDISGNDIEIYNEKIQHLVRIVRNWLSIQDKSSKPGPKHIWEDFNEFKLNYFRALTEKGFSKQDISRLPRIEYISLAREWIKARKNR
jgi:hypothetical protein